MTKSYFERTGKKPPTYMVERGKCLAAANKAAAGTPNDKGQFYKKVSRELHKQ